MNRSGGRTDETPLVRHRTDSNSHTMAVVRAVATVENEEPHSLAPLGDTVDTDALEMLVDGSDSASVTFSYAGHRIVLTGDAVEVYDSNH